jgi:hypothetical protein
MAIDKSEPRVGLIFRIGLLVVGLLIAIRALLNSYFVEIASAEESRKFGQIVPQPLLNLRADEEQRLTGGPMPVAQAMQAIVARGRMGASPDIMPSASRDLGPMQGWSKLPIDVPPAMANPPAEGAAADAGAPAAAPGDAGARPVGPGAPGTRTTSPGGGAPKKPAKKQP